MQLPSGRGEVNAWGENHLWFRYRKGSKLSGLVELRISVALALRVSIENSLYPQIPETLKIIRAAGYQTFVATSKPQIYATRIIEYFDLAPFFDGVYGSELDGNRSVKGDLISYIIERESLLPSTVLLLYLQTLLINLHCQIFKISNCHFHIREYCRYFQLSSHSFNNLSEMTNIHISTIL